MSWTDERVETLKRMWAEGQSASQIAKELGGVTRNAVIGKVHRLGLSNRNDEAPEAAAPAAPEAKPAPAAAETFMSTRPRRITSPFTAGLMRKPAPPGRVSMNCSSKSVISRDPPSGILVVTTTPSLDVSSDIIPYP